MPLQFVTAIGAGLLNGSQTLALVEIEHTFHARRKETLQNPMHKPARTVTKIDEKRSFPAVRPSLYNTS
jgi:hypothetical protein